MPDQFDLEFPGGSFLKLAAELNSATIGTINSYPLDFKTNDSSKLRIDTNGNVGIGTGTNPLTQKLEVNGTLKATAFQGNGSALTGKVSTAGDTMTGPLTISSNLKVSGNVGVGSTLSVSGRLSFGEQVRQMINLWREDYGIGVQSGTQYFRSASDFAWFRGGSHNDSTQNPGGGLRLMALNSAGDLILSARTNPEADSAKPMCRALVDLNRKLVINFANDYSDGVETPGNLSVGGNLKFMPTTAGDHEIGFTRTVFSAFPGTDSRNVFKLSLTSSFQGAGDPNPNYRFVIGHPGQVSGGYISYRGFLAKLSVDSNGYVYIAGDTYIVGRLNVQDLTVRSGNKSGYVSDYFINRVGDTLEQGDVVIISEYSASRFYATQNDIPIPEVDLTERAYDSRICGIVAKVVTEKDLPYVELEPDAQFLPEVSGQQENQSPQPSAHPLQQFAATFGDDIDTKRVQNQEMGNMVTLGAFSYCKVDADITPIKVGDLLTTSTTKGHAQKVLDIERATGAILGKALGSLEKGKGKIPVLVMLQ